ncbi:hypothetical protein HMPREF1155_1728 [Slackia sp. CM382]|nr:hypothetical protein HMPREF1155_1728 [Slackia sp. CM382]
MKPRRTARTASDPEVGRGERENPGPERMRAREPETMPTFD